MLASEKICLWDNNLPLRTLESILSVYIMIKRFLATALCCLMAGGVWAYDFSLTVASGQVLYFNVLEGGVEVTYPNVTTVPSNGWVGFTQPTGVLTVPATVSYNDTLYAVTSIGSHAFYGCLGLTQVVVESGVTSLGLRAFGGCSALTTVLIPASVTNVGSQALGDCSSLADVWCYASVPPTTASGAFFNTNLTNCTLHVPTASVSTYSTTAPWSGFGTIEGTGATVSLVVTSNEPSRGSVSGGGSYDVGSSVTVSALPVSGYAFICWNDGVTENPRTLTLTEDLSLVAMFFPLLHDTIELRDTIELHDTVTLYDTVALMRYRLQVFSAQGALGVGVGTTEVPAGTAVEICALPLQGGRFTGWSDGSTDNPRRVTVTGDVSFTAFFEQLSILSPETIQPNVQVEGREIVVRDANGKKIEIYDVEGRLVAAETRQAEMQQTASLRVPAAGIYVVRVGETGAVKVIVE